MSEKILIEQCSPTLAGIKTGSLFNIGFKDKKEFLASIRELNKKLVKKGIRTVPVRVKNKSALVYLYRPDYLSEDLMQEEAKKLLYERAYPISSADFCVAELAKRFKNREKFPHEVGLFLGYPPEDVKGFIENGAKNAKTVGTWKVYGDSEKARKKFDMFNRCTGQYLKAFNNKCSLESLIV